MVNLIWLGCNFALIFLIVIRVSNKESGVQSFAISAPLSPQKNRRKPNKLYMGFMSFFYNFNRYLKCFTESLIFSFLTMCFNP